MGENGKLYDMPSGAKLYVSMSAYEDVMALHDALLAELRGRGVGSLDVASLQKAIDQNVQKRKAAAAGMPFEDDGSGDAGMNVIIDKLLSVAGSKSVKEALFVCAQKSVYRPDGTEASSLHFVVGTPGFGVFDNAKCALQARQDFYEICKAVAEENLRPFGAALFSMFMAHMGISASTQKSTTP